MPAAHSLSSRWASISDFGLRISDSLLAAIFSLHKPRQFSMHREELEQRTKAFALRVIRIVGGFPKNRLTDLLGYQLLKAGTSVGANYREANRAESRDDFIHKVGIVEKEAAEAQYWLELFQEAELGPAEERQRLLKESGELLAIFTSIGKTAKARA